MADPIEAGPERTTRSDICDQVGRSVGSLWQRRFGSRPSSVSTEYVGDVVRCRIEPGQADGEDSAEAEAPIPARVYEQEAQAAVARLTSRKVAAFVAKQPNNDPATTNVFILERAR